LLRKLNRLQQEVDEWRNLKGRILELLELQQLAQEENDAGLLAELEAAAADVLQRLRRMELEMLLSGEYDDRDAILAIHAGAGGTDSQDWAEMLLRMYLRWAERRGFKTRILDLTPGEEAGIKSAAVEISGPYAYGYAKAEAGVHRLVRLSPFDAAHRRHTSFALVEVMPEVESDMEVSIDEKDLRIDTYRATGHGGQHVNKTESAVRITHLPTGIVVTCQNERSQIQNRETAMKILRARLLELKQRQMEEERARLKGEHKAAAWGNQIRSYILHPYTLVKDHRTDQQTSDVQAVLDGDIDGFIEAYLKWRLSAEAA
jgi:peptide chain release factor 2